ncbi:LOW QUALITY PROTEIN: coiled-coil domain-containing protein 87 [Discoglossus pictus]
MFEDIESPRSWRPTRKLEYTTSQIMMDNKKLNQLYNDILQPLTLFPNRITNEREKEDIAQRKSAAIRKADLQEVVDPNICADGRYKCSLSVEDVLASKYSPDALCELVKRRLHKYSALGIGSTDVRQIFEEIILSEVKVISESIPHVIQTALLLASAKQHLHQRLISHIIIVSEQLFMYYLHKLEWSKTQSVFSEEANLTRLKAQLLLDCSKFLNVFSVRRHLIAELKELEGIELVYSNPDEVPEDRSFLCSVHVNEKKYFNSNKPHFTMGYFIKLGRPKAVVHKLQRDTDLMQIEKIQRLDLEKMYMLIPKQEDHRMFLRNIHCEAVTTPCPYIHSEDQKLKEILPDTETVLKKCTSCPNLRTGDLLADELHITINARSSECPENLRTGGSIIFEDNFVSEDLKWLLKASKLTGLHKGRNQCPDEEIPPLIRAQCQGGNAAKLKKMKALLQAENNKLEQLEDKEKKSHLHSQPYSIDVKFPNKPLLRRADAQASDRIFTDFIEISKYPPVYNEFTSEIETASVKRLDGQLIVGQDLEEVYNELTMNLPKDHLTFEQNVLTEPFATNVDFSKCVSSSTLTKNKNQRVINKELDSLASIDKYKSAEQPLSLDKEDAKICNSWHVWWKSIINSDDYMKFLSTQDVDYLKVIYHLYSSVSEDEEQARIALMKKQEEQKRKREKKIADLRAEKQNHIPGMWNINSVMLGGLGRDPVLSDEEQDIEKVLEIPLQKQPSMPHELYQQRINAVWDILRLSHEQRLDMAIKYCSNEYQGLLEKAIRMWEKTATLVKRREELLAKLEMFEREASDPNRFFQKGYEGTGMARIKECKERTKLHALIAEIEPKVLQMIHMIKKIFNDTVTFKGRSYEEKMQRDKTEMLYFLQQKRRQTLIETDITKEMV